MNQNKSEAVKVVVRCRPMNEEEKKQYQKCVSIDISRGEITVKGKENSDNVTKSFFFDKVFDETVAQEQIFKDTALPIIESVVKGYNGTIFAYGQTGTGKTFTMEGIDNPKEKRGIIPRSFEAIFGLIKGTYNTNFLIRVSYLEIYNEEIRDLLSKNPKDKLDIREDPESGFYVKDLSCFVVKNPEDMRELMFKGKELRAVGGHDMNAQSSRSHSIFSIIVENSTLDASNEQHIRTGKLNLVDLAGSERISKTHATGQREKEGIKINLSLTVLGNVISALVSSKAQHVPYRDSKLTKLLMDSLGGNSKTVMIANVGPADYNYDETVNTLRYANRAKNIKNAPKINEDPKDAMIRQYQEELNKLKQMLAEQQQSGSDVKVKGGNKSVEEKIVKVDNIEKVKEIEDRIVKEKEQIEIVAKKEKANIEAQINMAEDEKLKLLDELKIKTEEQEKHHKNKEKLLSKLKMLEEKFVIGEETEKKAKIQEIELEKTRKELEDKTSQQKLLQDQIAKNEEDQLNFEKKYTDQKTEIIEKKKLYEKLKSKLKEFEQEKEDINKDYESQLSELYDYKKEIEKKLSEKDLIMNHLIPINYLNLIEKMMDYDEQQEEWFIPRIPVMDRKVQGDVNSNLAMGFHDDEELFQNNQNLMNNDIPLSMILEMNNQKNVYLTYDNDKKNKKGKSKTNGKTKPKLKENY